jgi:MATE family multidrug resistance protein
MMVGITIPEENQLPRRADSVSVVSSLMSMSCPLILRGLFLSVIQFFLKRHILAKKDESLLAAYGGLSAIEGFIFIFVFYSLHIISAKAGALRDEKADPKKVGDLYRQGLIFGVVLMLPALVLSLSAKSIFEYMRQPAVVIDSSHYYFSIGMPAYFFDMLYRVQARIAIGMADPTVALLGDSVESVVDVVVTDVLVNGRFGFPEVGVCAASWGYAMGAIAAWLGTTYYLKQSQHYQQYALFDFTKKIDFVELKNTITNGLYIAFTYMVADISQIILTFSCGLSGAGALVGLQAASTYGYLVSLPGDGVLEASTVLIAQYYEKNADRFHQISFFTFASTVGFSFFAALFLYANVSWAAAFFVSSDPAHRDDFEMVKSFLRVQACMEIINSVNHSAASLLSGCRETRYPFLLSTTFIFALNSSLIATTYFALNAGSVATFGVQLAGLILCAAGVGLRWKKELNWTIFWKKTRTDVEMKMMMRSESIRRLDSNEPLPAFSY